MTPVCEGLRVLDLSVGPVGGMATMILADFGADVIKVEPPAGDPFRSLAAAPMWLRGKQSAVLDLKTPAGIAELHRLAQDADVVVSSYRPGVAERLGADEARLRILNPGLIYCAITGFGPTGPYARYKGYEGVVAAKSGRMLLFAGQGDREGPVYAAVQLAGHAAAQAAVQGILAALIVRQRTGIGQRVETSLLQGMLPYDMAGLVTQQLLRLLPSQFPADPLAAYNRQPTLQYQPVRTKDGQWLQLGNLIEHLFHSFISAAGLSWIYGDPRFQHAPYLDEAAREALRLVILERMGERTAGEWMADFVADGNVAAEPVGDAQAALNHPQMIHNGDVLDVTTRRHGPMKQIGPIAKLSVTPAAVRPEAPELNEHRLPLAWLPRSNEPATEAQPHASAARRSVRHPLEGVTVVEFATIIAAPLGCALLGDLGARVIKVEQPGGDPLRGLGNGVSSAKTTASKQSIALDLKAPEAAEIVRRIVEQADIIVHNYRPGVPERLGIGYQQVAAYRPEIVYVAAMGYGTDGPYARRPSAHPLPGAAIGGALWQAGSGWPPSDLSSPEAIREAARWFMRANETNPDPSTSMAIATAALLGLYAREQTGRGQYVETNMFLANAWSNADDFLAYGGKPPRPLVDSDLLGLSALYRLYQTANGWVFLACVTDDEWAALCSALDRADLTTDPRFVSMESRRAHDRQLAAELAPTFRTRAAPEWERTLTAVDVACVEASSVTPGAFWDGDEHAYRNGFVREVEHPRWGPLWRHGPVVSFSETPGRYGAGTLAGQHTVQLLRELGYTADQIAALQAAGVAWSEPV